jgi:hypothetical protein
MPSTPKENDMTDIVAKLKTAAFIASAAVLVAACGEKAAETNIEVTTEETAPAADETMPSDEAAMEATPTDGAMAEAPAEDAAPSEEAPAVE